jgi:hypothetical protein
VCVQLRNDELLSTNSKLESDVLFERERYTVSARKLVADKDQALAKQTAEFNQISEKRKEVFMKLHRFVLILIMGRVSPLFSNPIPGM